MLVNLLLQDGRANYMEGLMCESLTAMTLLTPVMALYVVIALSYIV